jgi:hypothetical protein
MGLMQLEGQFDENEIQEVADYVADEVASASGGEIPLELRWKVEAAVKSAFGIDEEAE